jgi:phage shock protein A
VKLLGRIWQAVKGWLLLGVERPEDEECVLGEARETPERELARIKWKAIAAIGHRNEIRRRLRGQEKRAARLAARIRRDRRPDVDALAQNLLEEETAGVQAAIAQLKEEFSEVDQAAESLKQSIRDLEAQMRERAARRLARHIGSKQALIQEQLDKALRDSALDAPRVSASPRRPSEMSQRVGWMIFLLLLGVLGWRVWFGL